MPHPLARQLPEGPLESVMAFAAWERTPSATALVEALARYPWVLPMADAGFGSLAGLLRDPLQLGKRDCMKCDTCWIAVAARIRRLYDDDVGETGWSEEE